MAEPHLTPALARSLLASEAWRAYVTDLVEAFEGAEARYDASCLREDQGTKMALRRVIEHPYGVAEVASPLARGGVEVLTRRRRARKQASRAETDESARLVEMPFPARSSGLV